MKINKILYFSLLILTAFSSIYGMEDDSRGLKRASSGVQLLASDRPEKKQRTDEPNQPVANALVVNSLYAQLQASIAQVAKEHEQELYIEQTIKLILDGDVVQAWEKVQELANAGNSIGKFLNQIPSLFEKRPDIVPLDPNHPDFLTGLIQDLQGEIIAWLDDQDKAALACVNKHFQGLMPRYFKKRPFYWGGNEIPSFKVAKSFDFKPRWNVGNTVAFEYYNADLSDFIKQPPISRMLYQMLFIKKNVKKIYINSSIRANVISDFSFINQYPMIRSLSIIDKYKHFDHSHSGDDHSAALGDDDATALAQALEKNKTLTQLNLNCNEIDDEGATALADALITNQTLTQLNLGDNPIGVDGTTALAGALTHNKTLTELNLGKNSIGDAGATALAQALTTNKTLTKLYLERNDIGDAGAKALANSLTTNKTLIQLDLGSNSIGDAGAKALAQPLTTNETLTLLDLGWNQIEAAGAKALANSLTTNKTLIQLDLGWNQIGPDGALALAQALITNHTLTQLYLNDNEIGDDGRAALNNLNIKSHI